MRKIRVVSWELKDLDGNVIKDDKGVMRKESTVDVIKGLINMKKPDELPKGFDQFMMFTRISRALEDSETSNVITLDEGDYLFLKDSVMKGIPSAWGMNKGISESVTVFLESPEVKA